MTAATDPQDPHPPHFAATLDLTSRIISPVAALLLLAVAGVFAHSGFTDQMDDRLAIVGLLAALLVIATTAGLQPTGYTVGEIDIKVHRPLGVVHIALDAVDRAVVYRRRPPLGIRLIGSGGMFGYYGIFWSRRLGRHRAYATRLRPIVVLRLQDDVPVVLTPDDLDGFVALLAGEGIEVDDQDAQPEAAPAST